MTLEQQIRERQEEEEKTSPAQQQQQQQQDQITDEALQEDKEEEFNGRGLDFDDFNMMESFMYLDLPWPESP
jgi:hypothetical protein